MENIKDNNSHTVKVVFISLLLDLLSFTMILPLLPSILEHYKEKENGHGLYTNILYYIQNVRTYFDAPERVNTVLYGGVLGFIYSFLQFLSSPIIGALSDIYGRKPMLMFCLAGITFSHFLWAISSNFGIFVLARILGGITKGNISLSMAIITDSTSSKTRGRAMALVGIAFSIGFVVGPMIGALFARMSTGTKGDSQTYVLPAVFAVLLSASNMLYVACNFKESLPKNYRVKTLVNGMSDAIGYINPVDIFRFTRVSGLSSNDQSNLRTLGVIYFIYLFIYSGLESTLTFLTHHSFGFTSMQQGWMFLGIGLTMAILQGAWVRRIPAHRTKLISKLGLWLIIPAFIIIGTANTLFLLCLGIFIFAVSTAMVVTCMMTLVSRIGPDNQKGTITGIFRALGALARACGPILASAAFWCIGSKTTYLIGAAALVIPPFILHTLHSL